MSLCCPVDFILFALTLLGVAVFHHHTLLVALSGLGIITLYKLAFTGFAAGPGLLLVRLARSTLTTSTSPTPQVRSAAAIASPSHR